MIGPNASNKLSRDQAAFSRPAASRGVRPAMASRVLTAQPKLAADKLCTTKAPCDEPDLTAPPANTPPWLKRIWNFMLGNTENKLFQIKLNLLNFKDVLFNLMTVLQTGPLQPIFALTDKVGGVMSGLLLRFKGQTEQLAARGNWAGKLLTGLARASSPIAHGATVVLKFLERTAPIFGWLTAVQDGYKAWVYQRDKHSSPGRKLLGWTTFLLGAIGATATTISAWAAVGAAATAPLGLAPAALGSVAIVCFGLSLLTGWLAARMGRHEQGSVRA